MTPINSTKASQPSISIIIVAYHRTDLLQKCLSSIIDKSQKSDYEMIVVNNGQPADLEEVKKEFQSVTWFQNSSNLGFSKAANKGFSVAKGKYFLILNPDTVLGNDLLDILSQFLENHAEAGAVGPQGRYPDGTLQKGFMRSIPTVSSALYRFSGLAKIFPKTSVFNRYNMGFLDPNQIQPVEALSGAAMLIRAEVIKKIGSFDEKFFLYGEDLDLCLRISKAGYKLFYQPAAYIFHKHRACMQELLIKAAYHFHQSMWIFYKKHYQKQKSTSLILSSLVFLGIFIRFLMVLALLLIKNLISKIIKSIL